MMDHADRRRQKREDSTCTAKPAKPTVKKIKRPRWHLVTIPGKTIYQDMAPAATGAHDEAKPAATETCYDKMPYPDPLIQRRYLID